MRNFKQIREETGHYAKAEEHLSKANDADAKGKPASFHAHMAEYHDELSQWHESKGRSATADKHADKADYHHEKSIDLGRGVHEARDTKQELRDAMTRHTRSAIAAKGEGDSEKVKVHQAYINKIKDKLGKMDAMGEEAGPFSYGAKKLQGADKDTGVSEAEQIDELKKSTLGSYVKKAAQDAEEAGRDQEYHGHKNDYARGEKRQKGIAKAVDRLTKEDINSYDFEKDADASIKAMRDKTAAKRAAETPAQKDDRRAATAAKMATPAPDGSARVSPDDQMDKDIKAHRARVQNAKPSMAEEQEQIDELKTGTLLRYHTKAGKSGLEAGVRASKSLDAGKYVSAIPDLNTREKRMKGQMQAMSKIQKRYATEEAELEEAITSKDIKMAVGVVKDKRYAGGNMTGAVSTLEKIKKNLSNHPRVQQALKTANEEVDDEGSMAKGQLNRMIDQATGLVKIMDDKKQLDGWVQSKLTTASDYLDSVHDYLMHSKQDVDTK
jgi:hypothetical protein